MTISICIPHYNRIQYLIKSLEILELQNYNTFEVVISDDCSTDNTKEMIEKYISTSKLQIVYHRFKLNQGYDRNFRKSIELAKGDYCFILGNDDTLANENVLIELAEFLRFNNFPDLGFSNYCDFSNSNIITRRAFYSGIIGSGPDVGLKNYSCFSFVAGIIFKKSTFDIFNTDKFDNSIYSQIALAFNMICNNAILFSINQVWVRKDITIEINGIQEKSNSYINCINRNWFNIRKVDSGLKSIISLLYSVLSDNKLVSQKRLNYIFKKIYFNTYPFWILDFKYNNATPESVGLYLGLQPYSIKQFSSLNYLLKLKYIVGYQIVTILAFLTPSFFFFKFKDQLYSWIKRN